MTTIGESLRNCIENNNLEEFKIVCTRYCDFYDLMEETLTSAYRFERIDMVRFLVNMGVKPSDNLIDMESRNNNLNRVKLLHSMGAKCSTIAFDSAAYNGNLEMVKFMVSIDACYCDAIKLAKNKGHIKIVNYLESM